MRSCPAAALPRYPQPAVTLPMGMEELNPKYALTTCAWHVSAGHCWPLFWDGLVDLQAAHGQARGGPPWASTCGQALSLGAGVRACVGVGAGRAGAHARRTVVNDVELFHVRVSRAPLGARLLRTSWFHAHRVRAHCGGLARAGSECVVGEAAITLSPVAVAAVIVQHAESTRFVFTSTPLRKTTLLMRTGALAVLIRTPMLLLESPITT